MSKTHGLTNTPEYETWCRIKRRCKDIKYHSYSYYGGRGIKVCEQWISSFETFFKNMGQRPSPKHSIERIDNNGNYEPSNCTWATIFEQTRNRRKNKLFTLNGKTLCQTDWSYLLGGNKSLVYDRLKGGWPISKALSTPVIKK